MENPVIMMKTNRLLPVAAASVALGLLSACGTGTSEKSATDQPTGADFAATGEMPKAPNAVVSGRYTAPTSGPARELMNLRALMVESASSINFEQTLAEYLPNQEISVAGDTAKPTSSGVLVGEIVDVKSGAGYAVLDEDGKPARDAESGTKVAFDDPRAAWRVAVVTIKVDRALSTATIGDCTAGDDDGCTTQFGYGLYGVDPSTEIQGLLELEDVVVVLDPSKTYPDIAKGLPAVARSEALLGDIDDQGIVGFPALGEENQAFVASLDTVEAIAAQARKGPQPVIRIDVDAEGNVKR